MSKSIDYHEGYIQALIDIQKSLRPELQLSVRDSIQEHTNKIGKILDEMYAEYKKEKK